jgi:hypothetical protein
MPRTSQLTSIRLRGCPTAFASFIGLPLSNPDEQEVESAGHSRESTDEGSVSCLWFGQGRPERHWPSYRGIRS